MPLFIIFILYEYIIIKYKYYLILFYINFLKIILPISILYQYLIIIVRLSTGPVSQ